MVSPFTPFSVIYYTRDIKLLGISSITLIFRPKFYFSTCPEFIEGLIFDLNSDYLKIK